MSKGSRYEIVTHMWVMHEMRYSYCQRKLESTHDHKYYASLLCLYDLHNITHQLIQISFQNKTNKIDAKKVILKVEDKELFVITWLIKFTSNWGVSISSLTIWT